MPYADKQKGKEHAQQYYLKNKDKILNRVSKRYQEKKVDILAYHRDYFAKNRETILTTLKEYRTKNKDKYRKAIDKWMSLHVEEYKVWKKQWTKEYAKRNRHKIYARDTKRRQLKKLSFDETTDMEKIKQFYVLAESMTLSMGERYVVDHILPIIKGGAHHQDNLQVITSSDNLKKGSKYPFEVESSFCPSMDSQTVVA